MSTNNNNAPYNPEQITRNFPYADPDQNFTDITAEQQLAALEKLKKLVEDTRNKVGE